MSLPVPLSVRIASAASDRMVTREIDSLHFGSEAPGGFRDCTLALSRPIDRLWPDIGGYAKVYVYDRRNGSTVWEGALEDPGRSVGDGRSVWSLQALGGSAHASDVKRPAVYIDRRTNAWEKGTNTSSLSAAAYAQSGDADSIKTTLTGDVLEIGAQSGVAIPAGWAQRMKYNGLQDTGQGLYMLRFTHDDGITSATLLVDILAGVGLSTSPTLLASQAWSTSPQTFGAGMGSEFSVGSAYDTPHIGVRTSAAFTTTAAFWSVIGGVCVRAVLYDKTGAKITSNSIATSILASDVVADVLGRLLPRYDGTNATVATTSFGIQQMAYPDGATAADILDDCMALEPNYFWAAWESAGSGYRFEWKQWPTTVRYEASVQDGFNCPQSVSDLYSGVNVRWVDAQGRRRSTVQTQTIPALGGRQRIAQIDLGDSLGDATAAAQVAAGFLADHRYPANGGSLTIARPIKDLADGRWVMPWEIRPGELVRVRGVESYPDALNASSQDGVTVFRLASTDYASDTNSAVCGLGAPLRSGSRALALLQKRAEARRRR